MCGSQVKSKEVNRMYYLGADYHKDIVAVCIQNSRGKVVDEFETSADQEGLQKIIDRMSGEKWKIMGESSGYSINLHNYLLMKNVNTILVDPTNINLITKSDKKTDRHDANVLATFLRLMDKGEISLSISFIVRDDQRDLRDICRYRESLGQSKGKCIQRIKSHMRVHDQKLEGDYDNYETDKGQRMLREAFADDFILMSMLDDLVYFMRKAEKIDRLLSEEKYRTPEVKLLSSIPGIGQLTAVQIMSMIVDVGRFPTADKMRSYFGMSIRVMDSGGKIKHGHITKKGDPMMRSILGRVVNQFLKGPKDQSVRMYYDSHVDSLGSKKVRMACMNKILDIIFAVLKRGTPYISR